MITVLVSKDSYYPVSSTKIKKFLKDFFAKNGIVSDAEVSVAIVGEKEMLESIISYFLLRYHLILSE